MPSLNEVKLIGHVGKDPESRFLPNGNAVVNLTIATSEQWLDKTSGEKKEKTEWHRVTAFGKLAEIIGQYCTKGKLVFIEGKLTTRKWLDKSGADRYTTEINADTMLLLGGREPDGAAKATSKPAAKTESVNEMLDDIPF